jgi:hypothetical protein
VWESPPGQYQPYRVNIAKVDIFNDRIKRVNVSTSKHFQTGTLFATYFYCSPPQTLLVISKRVRYNENLYIKVKLVLND